MRRIQFYFDEDATQTRLVKALRSRGITVFTVTDTGKAAASDEEQLTAATTNECVLYTFNVADFYKIHMQWTATGREHAGIILAPQQRFSVGEQLRRLLQIRSRLSMDDMRDRAEFLANWS